MEEQAAQGRGSYTTQSPSEVAQDYVLSVWRTERVHSFMTCWK